MMSAEDLTRETQGRIEAHLAYCTDPHQTRAVVLVWQGYIAALLEWGLIRPRDHDSLCSLLPDAPESPVREIFLGVEP